ncbi:MAG: PrsW family intramembrane metalloprotease [Ignavibacteriales bacterium]|nr:MAG: PrsW family intramembrane metalloprotease [Ignavibacteriales bacterium]
MLIFASAVAAVVPMLLYLSIIWAVDRYDREPIGLVLLNFLWGALGAIILAVIGSSILSSLVSYFLSNKDLLARTETIIIAPLVEEITKGFFLFLTIRNIKFDNMTDGIVYGGAIGLGFGMTENFFYFVSYGTSVANWIVIVVIRTLFSAVMHCVATATFGAFLGYAKFKTTGSKFALGVAGLFSAMFIHFAWNFSVSFESTALLGFLFMGFTVIIFTVVFSLSVMSEKKVLFTELIEEVNNGIIPIDHLSILNSSLRRKRGWVDENIRTIYIKAATTLAFRKMQLKNSHGSSKIYYEQEVLHYRNFIGNLLGKPAGDIKVI